MTVAELDILAVLNRPSQLDLIDQICSVFAASPAVSALYIRGSLANGTVDKFSDVDVVIASTEDSYHSLLSVLDGVMRHQLNAILPGWSDTLAPDLGGKGFVYLLESHGRLKQVDVQVVSETVLEKSQHARNWQRIYTRGTSTSDTPAPNAKKTDAFRSTDKATQALVEVLVMAYLTQKRLARNDSFSAYEDFTKVTRAAASFCRAALIPDSSNHGWRGMQEELSATPMGRTCLRELASMITLPPIPTDDSLFRAVSQVVDLAQRFSPTTYAVVGHAARAWTAYLQSEKP